MPAVREADGFVNPDGGRRRFFQRRYDMFETGTMVVYGKNGTCRIEEIAEKRFFGRKRTYYILKPVHDQEATIYVPVDNEAAGRRMWKTLTREEVEELIEEIPEISDTWIADDRERKEKFQQILAQGSREDLVRLITTIYRQKQRLTGRGRKLHSADEQIFREAEKLLYDEISVVLGMEEKQVQPYIAKRLKEKEKNA